MDLIPLIVFGVALVFGTPVALALGAGGLMFFLGADGIPAEGFAQKLQSSFGSFPLLAIPLFVLAAALLNRSGVATRLLGLVETLVGRSTGGLGKANVLLATLMGGVSASAAADAGMQAKLVGARMVERGYPKPFVSAIVATSSIITPIIPPGIGFILYGAMTDTSIGRLFVAGIVPGLILSIALIAVVHVLARRGRYGDTETIQQVESETFSSRLMRAFRRAALALLTPVFIVVGIRFGIFTPTEASAVLVVIALVYGFVAYRELRFSDLRAAALETVEATASLMLIVSFATSFAFYLTWEGIPQEILRFVVSNIANPFAVLFLLTVVLVVAGMFLDTVSAMIILVPIIHPIATRVGIDPVHAGLLVVLTLTMGGASPPVGLLMYLTNAIVGCSVSDFVRAAWPFFLALLAVLALLILFPSLTLALPNALFGN